MIKILLIIPYQALQDKFNQLVIAAQTPDISIETTHIYGTTNSQISHCDADIVIARGITGLALKKQLPHVHLVTISMTSEDLIAALVEKKRRTGREAVAIVVSYNVPCNAKQLEEITGIPIHLYNVSDETDITAALEDIKKKKINMVVGGLTICHRCEELGIDSIHIKTGEEAIERAMNEAINAAHTLNAERTKTYLLTTVLNNTKDAILAVDRDGVIIAANKQVYRVFRLDKNDSLLQRHVGEIYENAHWESTMKAKEESDAIDTIGGNLMLISKKPMLIDAQVSGVLFVLQNVEKIREVETKIRKELNKKGFIAKYYFSDILSQNEQMKRLIASAYKYSQVESNILIIGETGTGKELFAQSIHNASKRSEQLFVAINCAAFPEQLLESELFGYVEGAFSGAVRGGKTGLFELAHKGTIFLDEIGEMPINLQAKLLRVLQEKEIRKVGDDKVLPVDVRVISATNINIKEKIKAGKFREDLYYRINLLNIKIPPLRERKEDIGLLFRYFTEKYAQETGEITPEIKMEAIEILKKYSWRGNIRELRNFSERMMVLNDTGIIDVQDVQYIDFFDDEILPEKKSNLTEEEKTENDDNLYKMLAKGSMSKTEIAKKLGMSRTTLWRKINQYKEESQG